MAAVIGRSMKGVLQHLQQKECDRMDLGCRWVTASQALLARLGCVASIHNGRRCSILVGGKENRDVVLPPAGFMVPAFPPGALGSSACPEGSSSPADLGSHSVS